ncbi:MAG: ABC transporter substrate-binding protein [Candidatus Hydrogenedentes bacterium]|nr:ABC transporter substrate-binding protein [Candidatus Hydrogenedentota bacterium]
MFRTYLSWLGMALACAVVLAFLWPSEAGSEAEREALRNGRKIITYWDRSQGHEYETHNELIREFNASQDRIYVRTLSVGWRIEKLLTAIASGAPPDVCSMEAHTLSQLAPQGCFVALDSWMATQPNMKPDDFFDHLYEMVNHEGRVWGIPTLTDSYCLLWNKAAFRKAGLDPERPPRTLKELEEFAAKLTVRGPGGTVEQIGFLPWLPWDFTYMWGGYFGGEWFDKERTRVTAASDPNILKSLEWQGSWVRDPNDPDAPAYALDSEVAQAFYNGFSAGGAYFSATNPFYTGKVAMIHEGEWQCTFIPKYAPSLDWGVAPIPQPEGAPPRSYSPSTVLDGIPSGSRNPDEALTFLAWFYAERSENEPSPASDYAFLIHNVPARRVEASQERFSGDPKFKVFVNELMTKPAVYFPASPVGRLFADQTQVAREYVMFGLSEPEAALKNLESKVNAEWDRVRPKTVSAAAP